MNDVETAGFLAASCWEHMSSLCEEHARAAKEHESALLEQFLYDSVEAQIRVEIAECALQRAEHRLTCTECKHVEDT